MNQSKSTYVGKHSQGLDDTDAEFASSVRWILSTLKHIDFQYDSDLVRLELSSIDAGQKNYIRREIVLKHRERREPYIRLLEELRTQQPLQSFAA